MNSVCSYEIYHPNEEKSYKVVWKGADPGLSGCKLSFKGQDTDDYTKEYNVCVKSEKFYLQSSGIRLKYLTGFNSYADKVRNSFDCIKRLKDTSTTGTYDVAFTS